MNASILPVRSLSLHLKLFVAAACCMLAFALVPAPAHAAGLTGEQIDAVLNLLSAFDVPQATIENVSAILHGQSEGHVSVSAQPKQAQPLAYVPPPQPPVPANPPMVQVSAVYQPSLSASSLVASAAMMPLSASADSLNLIADQVTEINYALAGVLSAYVQLFSLDTVAQAAAATVAPQAPPMQPQQGGESLGVTLAYLPQSLYETAGNTTDFLAAVEMAPVYVIIDGLTDTLYRAGIYW